MTRGEAIDLMANYTAMPRFQIALEVDRYITWPGQACAYKIGELQFIKWKQEAKKELGIFFIDLIYFSITIVCFVMH